MPEKNKLNKFKKSQVTSAFKAIKKGKKSVSEVAQQFDVTAQTVRYHVNAGTYANGLR